MFWDSAVPLVISLKIARPTKNNQFCKLIGGREYTHPNYCIVRDIFRIYIYNFFPIDCILVNYIIGCLTVQILIMHLQDCLIHLMNKVNVLPFSLSLLGCVLLKYSVLLTQVY